MCVRKRAVDWTHGRQRRYVRNGRSVHVAWWELIFFHSQMARFTSKCDSQYLGFDLDRRRVVKRHVRRKRARKSSSLKKCQTQWKFTRRNACVYFRFLPFFGEVPNTTNTFVAVVWRSSSGLTSGVLAGIGSHGSRGESGFSVKKPLHKIMYAQSVNFWMFVFSCILLLICILLKVII